MGGQVQLPRISVWADRALLIFGLSASGSVAVGRRGPELARGSSSLQLQTCEKQEVGANLLCYQAGRILKAKGAATCMGVEGTRVVPVFASSPRSSLPTTGALCLLLQDFSLQCGISYLTFKHFLWLCFFSPLVKHCSAALVLEKQKAQFTSPAFPKSLSVGCPVLDEGGQRHRAHVIPERRQHWAAGRHALTSRSSPCPPASFPAGTECGLLCWRSGVVLGSSWGACCWGRGGPAGQRDRLARPWGLLFGKLLCLPTCVAQIK